MHLLLSLMMIVAAVAQVSVHMLRLNHRQAEEIIPIVEGLYPGKVTVKSMNGRLFVRTTPELFAEVQTLVGELDRRPKSLLVSVKNGGTSRVHDARVGFGGDVSIKKTGPTGRVTGHISEDEASARGDADRSVRVVEGTQAIITNGNLDNASGFSVQATVHGEDVTIQVFQREGAGNQHQSASTTLAGKLGQWIDFGGVDTSRTNTSSGILSRQSGHGSSSGRVSLRVEVVE